MPGARSSPPPSGRACAPRAAALPADERRAAIVAATIPLLLAHGTAATTRQIAEAAGIAEGTIFRVFPDKDALIEAAVESALDPAPVIGALAEIDPNLAFEDRLVVAVGILQRRFADNWRLLSMVGTTKVDAAARDRRRQVELAGLAELFEPEGARLARDPIVAARVLRGLTFGVSHPALIADDPMAPSEIASILLDGLRVRTATVPSALPSALAAGDSPPATATASAPIAVRSDQGS